MRSYVCTMKAFVFVFFPRQPDFTFLPRRYRVRSIIRLRSIIHSPRGYRAIGQIAIESKKSNTNMPFRAKRMAIMGGDLDEFIHVCAARKTFTTAAIKSTTMCA